MIFLVIRESIVPSTQAHDVLSWRWSWRFGQRADERGIFGRWRDGEELWSCVFFRRFLEKWKVSWYYYVTMIHYMYVYVYMFSYWIYSTHHPPKNSSQKKWTAKLRDTAKCELHRPAFVVSFLFKVRPQHDRGCGWGWWRDLISDSCIGIAATESTNQFEAIFSQEFGRVRSPKIRMFKNTSKCCAGWCENHHIVTLRDPLFADSYTVPASWSVRFVVDFKLF